MPQHSEPQLLISNSHRCLQRSRDLTLQQAIPPSQGHRMCLAAALETLPPCPRHHLQGRLQRCSPPAVPGAPFPHRTPSPKLTAAMSVNRCAWGQTVFSRNLTPETRTIAAASATARSRCAGIALAAAAAAAATAAVLALSPAPRRKYLVTDIQIHMSAEGRAYRCANQLSSPAACGAAAG